jgi:hypothetical protein
MELEMYTLPHWALQAPERREEQVTWEGAYAGAEGRWAHSLPPWFTWRNTASFDVSRIV